MAVHADSEEMLTCGVHAEIRKEASARGYGIEQGRSPMHSHDEACCRWAYRLQHSHG